MSNGNNQTFRQYCETTLTTQEFNSLYALAEELPNVKKYNITRALNVPSRIPLELLKAISKKVNYPVIKLILEYNCSLDVMTGRELIDLMDFKTKEAMKTP